MRFVTALAAAAVLSPSASSQDITAQETPGILEDPAAPEETLSELERLSRSTDDPFEGVIEANAREPVSVTLRALDKITARYTDLEIEMHQIARFGSLELQPRTCDKRPPEEFPETTAFLEIFDTEFGNRASDLKIKIAEPIEEEIEVTELDVLPVEPIADLPLERFDEAPVGETLLADAPFDEAPLNGEPAPETLEGPQAEGVNIFRGWMFASSPALNALEHPVYDVWVIDCNTRVAEN